MATSKYTIFDNFDKLDLSPIAGLLSSDSISGSPPFYLQNIQGLNDSISYNTYNETNLTDLSKNPRPIAYNSNNMANGPVPDMFRYITNNRFYISAGAAEIYHISKLKLLESIIFISLKKSILADSVFYDRSFFTPFLKNFTSIFADAVMLYNNPFYSPGADNLNSPTYNEAINNYFIVNEDNFNDLTVFDPHSESTPIKGNIPTLRNPKFGLYPDFPQLLKFVDLVEDQEYISIMSYLYSNYPTVFEQIQLFLQRLIYPAQTIEGEKPRHNYFVSDLDKVSHISIFPNYEYEPLISKDDGKVELQLPNIYAYHSFKSNDVSQGLDYYKEIVRLGYEGELKQDSFSIASYYQLSQDSKNYFNVPTDDEEYLKYLKLLGHETTIFGSNFHSEAKNAKDIKKFFPVYFELNLPQVKSEIMNDINNDLTENHTDVFMTFLANYFNNAASKTSVHTFSTYNKNPSTTDISLTELKIFDIRDFDNLNFQEVMSAPNNKFGFLEMSLLGEGQIDEGLLTKMTAFLSRLRFFANSKRLTYDQIYNGEKCYSEILAFEVVKYDSEGNKLQSFFIPCLEDKDKTLIDSQIFRDKEYIYEVFSISLVVGSEYESELNVRNQNNLFKQSSPSFLTMNVSATEDDFNNGGAKVKSISLSNNPSNDVKEIPQAIAVPIIVRAPYYNTISINNEEQKKSIVVDNPPLPPDISFYPYKDIDNKILITLGVNYGSRRMTPVRVFPGDIEQINELIVNNLQSFGNFFEMSDLDKLKLASIKYVSDSFMGTYKVWRTTQKPINWGAFYSSVPVEISNQNATAFEDDISPNVDYYYFARFEDIGGKFSNPTDIFHVRMVREGGFPPYLIIKKYDFSEGRPPIAYEKSFKKYLKIRLADGTREFYNTDDLNKIDFGYKKTNSSSQLKKYKIRITSKKTGKKIDINLDFNKDISNQFLTNISKTATSSNPTIPAYAPLQEEFKNIEEQIKKKVIGDAPEIPSMEPFPLEDNSSG